LWSRGLALLCDRNGGMRFVREQRGGQPPVPIDPAGYEGVRDGDLVWTRATSLPEFLETVLPRIHARFVLVTGDEDWSIPGDFARARELCASSKVLAWFGQNFDGGDGLGKIFPLPIGLDFHTISNRRRWGHPLATPREQEIELEELQAAMPPNAQRLLRVHADFHFNKPARPLMGESREAVEAALRRNGPIDFEERRVPRLELWRRKTSYAFAVSPHGNGLDCHRTWESLALGNIAIVKRSPLDPLYEGLPVVVVNEWNDVTAENLSVWHRRFSRAFVEPSVRERLTNRYWIERIRAIAKERLRP
jgi:hypothetical protein